MNAFKFAIARAYAQLENEGKARPLTMKEKGTLRTLRSAVGRYRAPKAAEAAGK